MRMGALTVSTAARIFAHMRALFRSFNIVDRIYLGYFGGLGLVVAILHAKLADWMAFVVLHGVCIGTIIALAAWPRARGRTASRRVATFLHDWYPLAAFIICFEEVSRLSLLIVPHWQDGYVMAWETSVFAVAPTVWLQQLTSRPVAEVLNVGYFSYFLLLMIVGGALYRRPEKQPFHEVMTASVLTYMLCYLVFLLFPTEGPAHTESAHAAVEGGPFHWAVLFIQKHAGVHGNAFPSSHVAAGVVALVFAWKYAPRLAAWLAPFVVLLCVGAVYDGYHYASDVIAGAALGGAVSAVVLWVNSPARRRVEMSLMTSLRIRHELD